MSTNVAEVADLMNFDFTDTMQACFAAFDRNCDGNLNLDEFRTLCQALFRNEKNENYALLTEEVMELLEIFDTNGNGVLDEEEFPFCWNRWIKIIVHPVSAILIVDVQNDFISGTLNISKCPAKHNGEDVIKPINAVLETVDFEAVYYSYDWHPNDHVSFIDNIHRRNLDLNSLVSIDKVNVYDTVAFQGNPPMMQKMWPKHCVQNSWGSELHKDLKVVDNATKIYKGTNPEVDSYSVFCDNQKMAETKLNFLLKQKNITDLYLCGVAYDVCVGSSAFDALTRGYRTIIIDDCCRGVDILDIEKTKKAFNEKHGVVVQSDKIDLMVKGIDRRPELGYKLAFELKKVLKQ